MAGTIHVELCAPSHKTVKHDASSVIAPGAAGVFTVLPGHTVMLTTLTSGVVIVRKDDGATAFYAVHGGFAEVANDRVLILPDLMEAGPSIDRDRAEQALERAMVRLKKGGRDLDWRRAEAAAARARARIQAADEEEY